MFKSGVLLQMYSGALLATAARLAWDPSTYTWFRFLCAAQYRVSAAYVLAAGLWLAALVYLAAASAQRAHTNCLHIVSIQYCTIIHVVPFPERGAVPRVGRRLVANKRRRRHGVAHNAAHSCSRCSTELT